MKIVQKRTSRFVASLFNGLGIIACVSVSSCGSKGKNSKGNETDKFDGLKKKLKEANDNFEQLDCDDQKKIAEWFKDNPSQTNFKLTKDILEQIFIDNNSKLNDVAQKLGLDTDTDDEANKKVQEWLDKLNELNLSDFNDLDSDDLKKKVAQKFIEKEIDINDDDAIKNDLSSVLSEVQNEEETKNVTVKIETDGMASIVYSDNHSKSFDFKDLDALKNFVKALADKNVIGVEGGSWSLVLEDNKAKVCGHEVGFDYTNIFNAFLNCLNYLVPIEGLNFNGFKMTVEQEGVSLDDKQLNDDYFKVSDFWNQVKNFPALFGLNFSKLQIEQNVEKVKINGFETELLWNDVVEDSTIKNGWNNIFDLKEVKDAVDPNENKTVISFESGNATFSGKSYDLTTQQDLENLCRVLNKPALKIIVEQGKKFSLKWGNSVMICGRELILNSVETVDALLRLLMKLTDRGFYGEQIKVTIPENNKVKFGGYQFNNALLLESVEFWNTIFDHKNLFSNDKIYISYSSLVDKTYWSNKSVWFRCVNDNNQPSVVIKDAFYSFYNKIDNSYNLKNQYGGFLVDRQTFK